MGKQPIGHHAAMHRNTGRAALYIALGAIALSLFGFGLVLGNVAAGVRSEPDENGWAHLFQLVMAAQVPLFLLFIGTVDWSRRSRAIVLLCVQILAATAAVAALAWSGY